MPGNKRRNGGEDSSPPRDSPPLAESSAAAASRKPKTSMDAHVAARAAGLSHAPSADHPTAISAGPDAEAGLRLTRTASRATIPADQQTGTFRSRQQSNPIQDEEEQDEEYPWGPSHPCFPHLNPHVAINSPLYASTRVIRVKRDWMLVGDLAPTFANLYPEVLDPYISEDEFRDIIKKLNTELVAAFSPWSARAAFDAVMGVATLWLWEDLGCTGVKKRLRRLEEWMEEWNRLKGVKEGVRLIPLRRTGYMSVSTTAAFALQLPQPLHHGNLDTPALQCRTTSFDCGKIILTLLVCSSTSKYPTPKSASTLRPRSAQDVPPVPFCNPATTYRHPPRLVHLEKKGFRSCPA